MIISKYHIQSFLFNNLFYLIVFSNLLLFKYSNFQNGSFIIFFLIIIYLLGFKNKVEISKKSEYLISYIYIILGTFSIFSFFITKYPVKIFITEWFTSIFPVLIALNITSNIRTSNYMNRFCNIIFITFIFSLILFYFQPIFYRDYLNIIESTGTHIDLTSNFFRSIFGLTLTGSFGMIAFSWILWSKTKKNNLDIFKLLIFLIGTLLTLRRSSIILLAFSLLLYLFYKKKIKLIVIALTISMFGFYKSNIDLDFFSRVIEISEAFSERSDNLRNGINNFSIIGKGLGSFGPRSIDYNEEFIPDNWFIRNFVELGLLFAIISSLMTVNILIKLFKSVFLNVKKYFKPSLIICVLLLIQSIGSNILGFLYLSIIFWPNYLNIYENTRKISTSVSCNT